MYIVCEYVQMFGGHSPFLSFSYEEDGVTKPSGSTGASTAFIHICRGVVAVRIVINDGGVIVVLLEDDDCRIVHHILQIFVNEIVYVLIREVYFHLCIGSRAAC